MGNFANLKGKVMNTYHLFGGDNLDTVTQDLTCVVRGEETVKCEPWQAEALQKVPADQRWHAAQNLSDL